MNNDKQNRGFWKSLKDKGYSIALILCAAAIGISGYVYYRSNQSKTPDSLAGTGTAPSVTGQTATTPAGANGEEDENYVVGFRKGSDLTEAFNNFYKGAYKDGIVLSFAQKYGVQEAIVDPEA